MKFKLIYVDPPWHFKTYSSKGEGRSAKNHYDILSLDKIKTFPVKHLFDDDAILLMWVIDPMLPEALEVIKDWGFKYKTVGFTWVKQNKNNDVYFTGLGYYTRSNPEMCLLATRGKPKRLSKSVRQLIVSKRREHSRKPDEVYDLIEQLCEGPYLEIFARTKRANWSYIGNQLDKFK